MLQARRENGGRTGRLDTRLQPAIVTDAVHTVYLWGNTRYHLASCNLPIHRGAGINHQLHLSC